MGIVEKVLAQTGGDPAWTGLTLKRRGHAAMTWMTLMEIVTTWIFIIAGVVAFFYLIYSGFIYLTAGGNPDAAKKGQQGILNAIIGLVIIVLAYSIVRGVVSLLGT